MFVYFRFFNIDLYLCNAFEKDPKKHADISSYSIDNKPVVYLIEDAHCVPEVQNSISHILTDLYKNKSMRSVFVEGCSADQNFDYLRLYPLADYRDKVLSGFMNEGKIGGLEFFAGSLPIDRELKVYGLEDENLYIENKNKLIALSNIGFDTENILSLKNKVAKWFKSNVLTAENQYLLDDSINLSETVINLINNKSFVHADFEQKYYELIDYCKQVWLLNKVDMDCVLSEIQTALIDKKFCNTKHVGNLRERLKKMYLLPTVTDNFDLSIINYTAGNHLYKNLHKYLQIKHSINLYNKYKMSDHIHSFYKEYLFNFCGSSQTKSVLELYFYMDNIHNLFSLNLSSDQAKELVSTENNDYIFVSLPAILKSDWDLFHKKFNKQISDALQFYKLAFSRDEILQKNFINQYENLDSSCALIIGGFHKDKFISLFEQQGIDYVLVKPELNYRDTKSNLYYYQHFMSDIAVKPTIVHNKNTLAPSPVLSISSRIINGPIEYLV